MNITQGNIDSESGKYMKKIIFTIMITIDAMTVASCRKTDGYTFPEEKLNIEVCTEETVCDTIEGTYVSTSDNQKKLNVEKTIKESKCIFSEDELNGEIFTEEAIYDTIKDSYAPTLDTPQKLYAEQLIKEGEIRMKSFMEYGHAIENAALRKCSNLKLKDNGLYEDYELYALTECMNHFCAVQEQFEAAYERYYNEDYEAVIRIVNNTFYSIRTAYKVYPSKLRRANLSLDIITD